MDSHRRKLTPRSRPSSTVALLFLALVFILSRAEPNNPSLRAEVSFRLPCVLTPEFVCRLFAVVFHQAVEAMGLLWVVPKVLVPSSLFMEKDLE